MKYYQCELCDEQWTTSEETKSIIKSPRGSRITFPKWETCLDCNNLINSNPYLAKWILKIVKVAVKRAQVETERRLDKMEDIRLD